MKGPRRDILSDINQCKSSLIGCQLYVGDKAGKKRKKTLDSDSKMVVIRREGERDWLRINYLVMGEN